MGFLGVFVKFLKSSELITCLFVNLIFIFNSCSSEADLSGSSQNRHQKNVKNSGNATQGATVSGDPANDGLGQTAGGDPSSDGNVTTPVIATATTQTTSSTSNINRPNLNDPIDCLKIEEAIDANGSLNVNGGDGQYYGGPDEFNDAGRGSFLKLYGRAVKWRISTSSIEGTFPSQDIEADPYYKVDSYVIPFDRFVPQNHWRPLPIVSLKVHITAVALDETGRFMGRECELTHEFKSPLVFNLNPNNNIKTIHPDQSKVKFDLNNDGIPEQIGWIDSSAGFLALDLNHNGIIDNGSELFGQYTKIENTGKFASNGYIALNQYDENKDDVINDKDSIYKKLLIWVDENYDGTSQKSELKSLSSLKITKISLSYQKSSLSKKSSPLGNLIEFESRFWGPDYCGVDGCKTFDIFFGTR